MSPCRIIKIYPHITPIQNSSLRVQRPQNKTRHIESDRIKSMIALNRFPCQRRKSLEKTLIAQALTSRCQQLNNPIKN